MKNILALVAALSAGLSTFGPAAYAQSPKPAASAASMMAPAKKMPMRDAKGRFMKASPSPSVKKLPMRDAKGHFMKASPAPSKKTLPMRDAKGRFMKASPAPAK